MSREAARRKYNREVSPYTGRPYGWTTAHSMQGGERFDTAVREDAHHPDLRSWHSTTMLSGDHGLDQVDGRRHQRSLQYQPRAEELIPSLSDFLQPLLDDSSTRGVVLAALEGDLEAIGPLYDLLAENYGEEALELFASTPEALEDTLAQLARPDDADNRIEAFHEGENHNAEFWHDGQEDYFDEGLPSRVVPRPRISRHTKDMPTWMRRAIHQEGQMGNRGQQAADAELLARDPEEFGYRVMRGEGPVPQPGLQRPMRQPTPRHEPLVRSPNGNPGAYSMMPRSQVEQNPSPLDLEHIHDPEAE